MDDGDPRNVSLPATLPESEGPLVSVITPTYEDAHYMGRALQSLSEQTYTNLELIVVNSSGHEWLEDLLDPLSWAQYISEPPNGVAAARNRGLDAADGEVIAFLDADDFYAPTKLQRQVAALEDGYDVVYSNVTVIESDGSQTELSALPVADPDRHTSRSSGSATAFQLSRSPLGGAVSKTSASTKASVRGRTPICGFGCFGTER